MSQFTSLLSALSQATVNDEQLVGCALGLGNNPELRAYLECAGKTGEGPR